MGNPSHRHPRFLFRNQLDYLLLHEPPATPAPQTVQPGSKESDEETQAQVPVTASEKKD
jgi:hypothetical protein